MTSTELLNEYEELRRLKRTTNEQLHNALLESTPNPADIQSYVDLIAWINERMDVIRESYRPPPISRAQFLFDQLFLPTQNQDDQEDQDDDLEDHDIDMTTLPDLVDLPDLPDLPDDFEDNNLLPPLPPPPLPPDMNESCHEILIWEGLASRPSVAILT